MTKQLTDALKEQKKNTQKSILQISGTLGIPIGGERRVEVPNRNSFVYVKLRDNQNEVIQAFNNKVAPSYGLPVIVERQKGRYVVVSVDTDRYQNNWSSFAPFLPRHGNTHSFDLDSGGGGDIAWIHSRQFMPALIFPSGSSGGPSVVMASYTIKNSDGTWMYVGNTGTTDLTVYNPNTGTQAVMALVYLDSLSGNPYLMVGSGSYFPSTITGTSAIVPYIPTLSNPNHIPLAAVRLVSGTTNIGWDSIYDVRQFIHTTPTGTGGGGGSVTGSFDNVYLKLDTSNDPLTDQLNIINRHDGNGGLYAETMGDAYTVEIEQLATGTTTITSPALFVNRTAPQGVPDYSEALVKWKQTAPNSTGLEGDGDFLNVTYNNKQVMQIGRGGAITSSPTHGVGGWIFDVAGNNSVLSGNHFSPSGTDLTGNTFSATRLQYMGNEILSGTYLDFTQTWPTNEISQGRFLRFRSNGTERILIDPSAQGTGTNVIFDGDYTLSNGANLLLLRNNGNPKFKINGAGWAEFGLGVSKESNAGVIGYEAFGAGYLDIVGAGPSVLNRWVRIFDNLEVPGYVEANNIRDNTHSNMWVYLNATGTISYPTDAPIKTNITGSDYLLGLDSENSNNSVRFPMTNFNTFILPFATYVDLNPITATGEIPYASTVHKSMTFLKFSVGAFTVGANHSGTNYYTISVVLRQASGDTTIATVNTQTLANGIAGTKVLSTTSFSPNAVSGVGYIYVSVTKTGTASDFYMVNPILECRA